MRCLHKLNTERRTTLLDTLKTKFARNTIVHLLAPKNRSWMELDFTMWILRRIVNDEPILFLHHVLQDMLLFRRMRIRDVNP